MLAFFKKICYTKTNENLTTNSLFRALMRQAVGVDDGEGTPVPIPNTEVKLTCVEDTWLVTTRENR